MISFVIDDEWLCSGSKLTSLDAVCGNLARALRRTPSYYNRRSKGTHLNYSILLSGT